jgi:hypothetical protein
MPASSAERPSLIRLAHTGPAKTEAHAQITNRARLRSSLAETLPVAVRDDRSFMRTP